MATGAPAKLREAGARRPAPAIRINTSALATTRPCSSGTLAPCIRSCTAADLAAYHAARPVNFTGTIRCGSSGIRLDSTAISVHLPDIARDVTRSHDCGSQEEVLPPLAQRREGNNYF